MPSNTNTSDFANGSVALDAQVVRWDDSQIEISYTLDNQSTDELVVFDSSVPGASSVLVDGVLRLFRAKYDPGITFITTPLLGGRLLPAGQSVAGIGARPVPVTITYQENSIDPIVPDSIEFCIGFGKTEDMGYGVPPAPNFDPVAANAILEAGADGVYSLNGQLELQSLLCVMLAP